MRTVLVTGASGILGAHVLEHLRPSSRTRALLHRHAASAADEHFAADLISGAGLDDAVAGVDAVVHLAAVTHARRASAYARVNVGGTKRLVDASERAGVRRFVHVSTRAIHASGGAYSSSKASAEEAVRASRVSWTILRLAEVYGGASGEGVDDLIARARAGRPLILVGRGAYEVCPLHVDDAAAAIAGAVTRDATAGRTITVGGECMTLRALADECVRVFGGRSRIVCVPEPIVAAASAVARVLPLPLVPDQLARLRGPKERPSRTANDELGFMPRPLRDGLVTTSDGW